MSFNQNNDKYEKSSKKGYHKFRYKLGKNKQNKYSDNRRSTWRENFNRQQSNSQQNYYHNGQKYAYYQNNEYQNQKIWSYPSHRSRSNQEIHSHHNVSDSDKGNLPLPGSEAERSSKIELDKKRIKEALSSVDTKNDNINTILTNEKREKLNKLDKLNEYVPLQELCLTPSDYKDIGSVDTSQVDTVAEIGDNALYLDNYKHPKYNDNKPSASSSKDKIKPLQSSGWRVSDATEVETVPSPSVQTHHQSSVDTNSASSNKIVNSAIESQEVRYKGMISSADTARIGRLYRSFLKSRLSGRASKISSANQYSLVRDNQSVSSVKLNSAGSHSLDTTAVKKHSECEIEMPLPVQVKIEVAEKNYEYNQCDKNIEAIEADEFCKEFSHLLVHPDYIIPSDVLEKLGLQDLLEMNLSLINDKNHSNSEDIEKSQCDNTSDQPQSLQSFNEKLHENSLRIKSVDTLNMTNSRNALSSTQVGKQLASSLHSTVISEDINKSGSSSGTTLIQTGAKYQELDRQSSTSKHKNGDKGDREDNVASGALNLCNTTILESAVTCMCSKNEKNVTATNGSRKSSNISKTGINTSSGIDESVDVKLFDISSRILRLFVIDKQIQELMDEKTNIYNELLSQKEIASTLFNSWADNHLKQQRSMLSNDSHQYSKSSELVKQMCSVIDTSSMSEQSRKSQNELVTSSSMQSRTDSREDMSNVCDSASDENSKVSCVSLNKLIGSCKENLLPVKKEMVDDVLNLYSSCNNSADNQNVYNKATKKTSHNEIRCVTPENDNDKLLQRNRDLNKTSLMRESENLCNRIINSSSDKRKHICGDTCMSDGCICRVRTRKKKKVEDAVDIIDFINLDTDSGGSDAIETGATVVAPKMSPVSRSTTGTSDTLLKSKSKEVAKEFENPWKPVLCLKVVGKFCYAGNRDGELLKYFVNTGEIVTTLRGHTAGINSIILYRKWVITGSCDNTIRCFSAETDKQLYCTEIGCPVQSMDERNGFLYAGTKFGFVFIYSLQKESFISVGEPLNLTDCNILAIKAAKEGARNIIIVAARGQPITVRDASSGLLLRTFTWCATVYCLQLFRESPLVYCGTNSKSVVVTDFTTGESKFDCNTGKGVVQIIFAHGLMFTACYDGNVYVYDVQAETLVACIPVCKQMLLCMDILKNKIIVSTSGSEVKSIPFPGIVKRYIKGTMDSVSNISV